MPSLDAPDYTIARFLIERGIALIYVIAFLVAANQFPALSGEHGLQPAPRLLARTRFLQTPSLFHWGYSDRRLAVVAWAGVVLSLLLVIGLPQRAPLPVTMATWIVLWVLYQSIVNVGGTFYGFGWESLLLEAGFLAIFLGNDEVAPPWLVLLAFRWLAFRVEFGAGLIKLRGDPCWRSLRCMDYHHETQPMPNPLSWFFHHLPRPLHRVEVLGNFFAQLVLPFGLFLPQPFASIAALLMIATQLYLVVSGNYAWLNWLTIVACVAAIADPAGLAIGGAFQPTPVWFTTARHRRRRARRRPELVAGPEHGQPGPGDERVVQPVPHRQHVRRIRLGREDAIRGRRRGCRRRCGRRTTSGASTRSRASPATRAAAHRRSRRTTTGSTG